MSWSTRCPFTHTTPASERSSPVMIFRIVDFPEPLAPRMIFVWPLMSVKLRFAQHDLLVERQLHAVEDDHGGSRLVEDVARGLHQ